MQKSFRKKLILKINIIFIKILIKFKLLIFRHRISSMINTILSAEDYIGLQYITKLRWQISNNFKVDDEFSERFLNLLNILETTIKNRNITR